MNLVSQTDGDAVAVRRRLLGDRADALDPLAEASAA
jgi:hypothetical protein